MPADHDSELGALVAELDRVGLLETYTQDDGRIAYRLVAQGSAVGRCWRWVTETMPS